MTGAPRRHLLTLIWHVMRYYARARQVAEVAAKAANAVNDAKAAQRVVRTTSAALENAREEHEDDCCSETDVQTCERAASSAQATLEERVVEKDALGSEVAALRLAAQASKISSNTCILHTTHTRHKICDATRPDAAGTRPEE